MLIYFSNAPLVVPVQAKQSWSLDFMSDSLSNGGTFRTFNVIDDFNWTVLWIEVDSSLPAEHVVRVLEQLHFWRVKPIRIHMENSPQLISKQLKNWAQEKNIELLHNQPSQSAQNAYIERFNRTYREDFLDAYLFEDLEEVRILTERWLED